MGKGCAEKPQMLADGRGKRQGLSFTREHSELWVGGAEGTCLPFEKGAYTSTLGPFVKQAVARDGAGRWRRPCWQALGKGAEGGEGRLLPLSPCSCFCIPKTCLRRVQTLAPSPPAGSPELWSTTGVGWP